MTERTNSRASEILERELAAIDTARRRLEAEHVPDEHGRCVACPPRWGWFRRRWPCRIVKFLRRYP